MFLTDTPVKKALEAEAAKRQAKMKRTRSRKVARTLIPKIEVTLLNDKTTQKKRHVSV